MIHQLCDGLIVERLPGQMHKIHGSAPYVLVVDQNVVRCDAPGGGKVGLALYALYNSLGKGSVTPLRIP
jgi:hypothetical protein